MSMKILVDISAYRGRCDRFYRWFALFVSIVFGVGFTLQSKASLPSMLTMYKGESRIINGVGTKRLSVGNTKLVSSTLLESGEIVLIAESEGETNLQLWFQGGKRLTIPVIVLQSNTWREALEVRELLKGAEGLSVKTIGNRIVIDGTVDSRNLERVKIVKERYGDILILAREITDFEQKMLHFDVRITEINRSVTENIGVDWDPSFAGPTLGYENIWNAKSLGQFPKNENALVGTALQGGISPIDLTLGSMVTGSLAVDQQRQLLEAQERGYTYWGIGTKVSSLINLLEANGAAITLANPRLSSRSGGTAKLTVGGEIPVVTSSVSGQSVTYKNYGIILEVEPTIDLENNISAKVVVEVSQVDLSNSVGDQPAFATRKSENHVRLAPGETLALAGIISRDEQMAYTGVKWLSRIPVLGNLFRSKAFEEGESELVILISPTSITDTGEGVNDELVTRAEELVKEFEVRKKKLSNF